MSPGVRRRRRLLPVALGLVVALVAAWGIWGYAVVQTPRLDTAGPVDAVLVLGGLTTSDRVDRALALVDAGLTHTVVISTPPGPRDPVTRQTCKNPPAGVNVVCFKPDPSTTRGEARELAQLAGEHGWTRVAVVTSPYHVSRSRMIVGRCFDGTVLMLKSNEHVSVGKWAYEYLYQTLGYLKAFVLSGC